MRQHVAFFTSGFRDPPARSGRIGRFQERLVDFRPSSLNFSSGKGHESFVRFRGTPGQGQHDLDGSRPSLRARFSWRLGVPLGFGTAGPGSRRTDAKD